MTVLSIGMPTKQRRIEWEEISLRSRRRGFSTLDLQSTGEQLTSILCVIFPFCDVFEKHDLAKPSSLKMVGCCYDRQKQIVLHKEQGLLRERVFACNLWHDRHDSVFK